MSDIDVLPPAPALHRGVLFGVGAGIVGGVVWFLVVLGTTSMTTYLIPALGVGVAYGVHRGMHRPGRGAAVVSVIVTAVTVALSLYYVERHLVVNWFTDSGDSTSIPLVPYLDWMVEVLRHAFHKGPAPALYSVLALVAGGWFGFNGFALNDNDRRTPPTRRR
ncbi:MAG: hypothetical protein Q7V57_02585 [Actinomycetota bacterium]|nr:hypothetical protein [Actinomycetota bacterium]